MGLFSVVEAKKNALRCLNCLLVCGNIVVFGLLGKLFDLLFGSLGENGDSLVHPLNIFG